MSKISPLYDDVILNATIVSDTHIDEKHPLAFIPKFYLKRSLMEAQNSTVPTDVYLTVGDTTSRGSTVNWELALDCFSRYKPADKVILTVGNHDCWSNDGFEFAYQNFIKYYEKICGDKINKPYYSYIIKGYHFIFLGNDADSGCEANISDAQFEWFSNELKAASESNKPIFVFCHQSLNQKHGLPRTWDKEERPDREPDEGGIGERSDDIEQEMKKYKHVFYFSGHSHMGIAGEEKKIKEGYSSIEVDESLTLINLPSLSCGNHHGSNNDFGIGFQLEVYNDKVLLRPRNYVKGKWVTDVSIQNGNPYFEHIL